MFLARDQGCVIFQKMSNVDASGAWIQGKGARAQRGPRGESKYLFFAVLWSVDDFPFAES